MAIRRRSQFRNRINKIRGMPVQEKNMLLRIAELVDGTLNNRTPGNPNPAKGHITRKRKLPIPRNLNTEIGVRGAVLKWDKVQSPELLGYKVRITPRDGSGNEFTAIAYSNQYLFRGAPGSYKFEMQTIGRGENASPYSDGMDFDVPYAPMELKGDKFDVEELGIQLNQTVYTPLNYTVFAFVSLVLKSPATPSVNPSVVVELSRGFDIENRTIIQSLTLFPENESLSSLDDDAFNINRPSLATLGESYETTHSVMFTPLQILEGTEMVDQDTKFWATVTNHTGDVVGMSFTIWVASEGLSEEAGEAPGDFFAYFVPDATENQEQTLSGAQLVTVAEALYDAGAGSPNLGADLSNQSLAYLVLYMLQTNYNSDATRTGFAALREGADASILNATGTRNTSAVQTTNVRYRTMHYGMFVPRPLSSQAEWGINMSYSVAGRGIASFGTFVALPLGSDGTFVGSTLGTRYSTFDSTSFLAINSANYSQGGGENNNAQGFVSIAKDGDYLCLWTIRPYPGSLSSATMRWTPLIDDEDAFNIRTGSISTGATKDGQGYSMDYIPYSVSPDGQQFLVARVVNLEAGSHTMGLDTNLYQGDFDQTWTVMSAFLVNTEMFNFFENKTRSTAITSASTTFANVSEWRIDVTANGTSKYLLILNTNVHMTQTSGGSRFRITKNGVALTPSGADANGLSFPTMQPSETLFTGGGTDNSCLPYVLMWVDTPSAGTHIYRIQHSADIDVGGGAAVANVKDDGTDGFVGSFMVAEISFATSGF